MKIYVMSILWILFLAFNAFGQVLPNRIQEPLVLQGNQLNALLGQNPARIVGFKNISGRWFQIPIQIDERELKDIVSAYGALATNTGYPPSPTNPKIMFYSDAATFTGADSNATFDADDELSLMLKDAGGVAASGKKPRGTLSAPRVRVSVTDPLDGKTGYVYLLVSDGTLAQNAGVNYVTYNTNLPSTSGFPANLSGVNLENSTVTTTKYAWHFAAEWISDELKITEGGATGVDILDRYKNFFANGNCARHEDAFSAGENAFATNKTGAIRAIRSYMGAVSGPLTQRTHLFYEGRQDIYTDLRVHNIASIYDAFDYNPAANGSVYCNDLNQNGVTIDGNQDAVTAGNLTWEAVSGSQGSLVILHTRTTTLTNSDADFTSYYDDNRVSPASNCTGDGQAWGTGGIGIIFRNGSVCTDPLRGGCGISSVWYRTLRSQRTVYFLQPNAGCSVAASYLNRQNNTIAAVVTNF
jgi:hypothetical protein